MPTWNEFVSAFTVKELIFCIVVVAIIILAREERRIFRRKS